MEDLKWYLLIGVGILWYNQHQISKQIGRLQDFLLERLGSGVVDDTNIDNY